MKTHCLSDEYMRSRQLFAHPLRPMNVEQKQTHSMNLQPKRRAVPLSVAPFYSGNLHPFGFGSSPRASLAAFSSSSFLSRPLLSLMTLQRVIRTVMIVIPIENRIRPPPSLYSGSWLRRKKYGVNQ